MACFHASSSAAASSPMATASNAIPVPRRRNRIHQQSQSQSQPQPRRHDHRSAEGSRGSDSSSTCGSYGASSSSSLASTPQGSPESARRASLMSATFSRAEHTVVNVGDAQSPRLITCVKASQGFDWNQEIFLPSYADYHFDDLETRKDPVLDIILTDEEAENMVPS